MDQRDLSWAGIAVEPRGWDETEGVEKVALYAWNATTLQWERYSQTGTSSTNPTIVQPYPSSTSVVTQQADSATNVTLLSANTARRGGSIYNDSTSTLYIKFGTTASTTSYTTKLFVDDYYEIPFQYTGIIDGIWASAVGGFSYTTELTA